MLMQPISTGFARDPQLENARGSREKHGDSLLTTENRCFTYKELQKFTNNFKWFIGKGGFGLVYYGCLEDDTEVAVKMRSESSSHGIDEFIAEVQTKILGTKNTHYKSNFTINKFLVSYIYIYISCYLGSELDKGASQEFSVFDWLLLGGRSLGTGL